MQVLSSGVSNSFLYRLKREEFIELLRRKLALPLCVARGPCARCLCGAEFRNFLDPNEIVRTAAGTLLTGHAGVCPEVAGGLFASRHDNIKRTLAQVHRDTMHDIHIAIEERIPGLVDSARVDLMISEPRRGQVTPIDVGFVSASLSATVVATVSNLDATIVGKGRRSIIFKDLNFRLLFL